MDKSYGFYSKIPGFTITYFTRTFTTFTLDEINGRQTHLNLELANHDETNSCLVIDFERLIFHTDDVDALYSYLKNDKVISKSITIETKPENAYWGERYFHIRDPDGYQISFAE